MLRPPAMATTPEKRNRDRSQWHALRSRKGDGLLGEVIGGSHQENKREEKPSQNDHRSLPKACCLHIFGNCDRIRCHVLPPFVFLVRLRATVQTKFACTAKIDFCSFSITVLPSGRSLRPGNSLEPTPGTSSAAGLRFCSRAQFGRANRNPGTCAPENSRTFRLSRRLQER